MSSVMESAIAKAVNGRSEYQKPLIRRLDQMVARFDHMEEENQRLRKALERADQFIENGIEMGYIRLPDAPDPALETRGIIRAALNGETS